MRLGVNVDHIATLRQARRGRVPDPVEAALICERSGAQGIVCHLREDRRHIQEKDLRRLRCCVTTRLNLEMSIARDIVRIALAIRPDQVTLVPERRRELTTEGGLDVRRLCRPLRGLITQFQKRGVEVSLFIDPEPAQVRAAKDAGGRAIELHTGRYANARSPHAKARALERIARAAHRGKTLGLRIAAGHGLDYDNVPPVAAIPEAEELNIGFSIISRALAVGLEQAVRDMVGLIQAARRPRSPRRVDGVPASH